MGTDCGRAGRLLAAAIVAVTSFVPIARAGVDFVPRYAIHDLGSLGGGSIATGLSDDGRVVGSSLDLGGREHSFLWDEASGLRLVHAAPAGGISRAAGVNDRGQVIGTAIHADGRREAFLWSDREGLRLLGTLGGTNSAAHAINSRGMVVGGAQQADGRTYAFSWTEGRGMTALGGRRPEPGVAYAVNRHGHAAGEIDSRAVVWTGGRGLRRLKSGSLPRTRISGTLALALNDAGVAAGAREVRHCLIRDCFFLPQAAFWQTPRKPVALVGTAVAACLGINNRGAMVGFRSSTVAAAWTREGARTDLTTVLPPDAGWSLHAARAINASGQIVGDGLLDGARRAFLLTPFTAPAGADLSVTLVPSRSLYAGGETGCYTVRVVNHGPDPAASVTLTQELSAAAPFAAATASAGEVTREGDTLTWSIEGLPAGGGAQLLVDFTVVDPVDFATTARVASPSADPYPLNNAASALARGEPASRRLSR